jgi:polysaccharide export outer membrane protein
MVKALKAGFAATVLALGLAGCAHKTRVPVASNDEPYRIGREDVLDVSVWRDADLSRTIPVRPDGFISLPMVGEVKAEGKTPVELEKELKTKLTAFVVEPKVTVIVREVNSSRVFITGEVTHPGAYPIRGRTSVVQAIALAGGFSDFASSDGIVVLRNNSKEKYPVRYSDLVDADDKERVQFFLMPGDTIVVP